jgi:hypothetical protein
MSSDHDPNGSHRFCKHCGAERVLGASSCAACNAPFTESSVPTSAAAPVELTGQGPAVAAGSPKHRRWLIMAAVALVVSGGVAAGSVLTGSNGNRKSVPLKTAVTNYAPSGSSPSYADGYNSAEHICRDNGWSSCVIALENTQGSDSAATIDSYCKQIEAAPHNYGGPSADDNQSQWMQGCLYAYGSQQEASPASAPSSSGSASVSPSASSETTPSSGSSNQQPLPASGATTSPPVETTSTLPPTTTTTTANPNPDNFPPTQLQFLKDVVGQVPAVANAIAAQTITNVAVVSGGQSICNGIFGAISSEFPSPYVDEVVAITHGDLGFAANLTTANAETIASSAIEDLCPSLVKAIPPGDPGGT